MAPIQTLNSNVQESLWEILFASCAHILVSREWKKLKSALTLLSKWLDYEQDYWCHPWHVFPLLPNSPIYSELPKCIFIYPLNLVSNVTSLRKITIHNYMDFWKNIQPALISTPPPYQQPVWALWNHKSDPSFLPLKILQWFPSELKVNIKILNETQKMLFPPLLQLHIHSRHFQHSLQCSSHILSRTLSHRDPLSLRKIIH